MREIFSESISKLRQFLALFLLCSRHSPNFGFPSPIVLSSNLIIEVPLDDVLTPQLQGREFNGNYGKLCEMLCSIKYVSGVRTGAENIITFDPETRDLEAAQKRIFKAQKQVVDAIIKWSRSLPILD